MKNPDLEKLNFRRDQIGIRHDLMKYLENILGKILN